MVESYQNYKLSDRGDEIRLIPDVVAMDLEKIKFIERLHPKQWLNAAREHQYAAALVSQR
jgi:hypothetical protein